MKATNYGNPFKVEIMYFVKSFVLMYGHKTTTVISKNCYKFYV